MDRWLQSLSTDVASDVAITLARLRGRLDAAFVSGSVLALIAVLSVTVLAPWQRAEWTGGQPPSADAAIAGPRSSPGPSATGPDVDRGLDAWVDPQRPTAAAAQGRRAVMLPEERRIELPASVAVPGDGGSVQPGRRVVQPGGRGIDVRPEERWIELPAPVVMPDAADRVAPTAPVVESLPPTTGAGVAPPREPQDVVPAPSARIAALVPSLARGQRTATAGEQAARGADVTAADDPDEGDRDQASAADPSGRRSESPGSLPATSAAGRDGVGRALDASGRRDEVARPDRDRRDGVSAIDARGTSHVSDRPPSAAPAGSARRASTDRSARSQRRPQVGQGVRAGRGGQWEAPDGPCCERFATSG